MLSKLARQGFLMIDNRHAPGPGGVRFREAATVTCSHCQRQLVRDDVGGRHGLAWCASCDAYVCDECKAIERVAGCKTFKAFMAEQDDLHHKLKARML